MSSFIDDCIKGNAKFSDLDKYIENWEKEPNVSLEDYLGITKHELRAWQENQCPVAFLVKIAQFPKNEDCQLNFFDEKKKKWFHITRNIKNGKFTLYLNNDGKIEKTKTRNDPYFF